MIYLAALAVLELGLVGYLAHRLTQAPKLISDLSHQQFLERRELLNRIQAPALGVSQSLPDEPPVYEPWDEDPEPQGQVVD